MRILKHPVKNTNVLGPAWQNIAGNHHIHEQKKIAYSYSDTGGTLEKIKQTKALIILAAMNNFTFQKRSKKMLLHQRAISADRKQ